MKTTTNLLPIIVLATSMITTQSSFTKPGQEISLRDITTYCRNGVIQLPGYAKQGIEQLTPAAKKVAFQIRNGQWRDLKNESSQMGKVLFHKTTTTAKEFYLAQDPVAQRGLILCGISLAGLAVYYPVSRAATLVKRAAQLGLGTGAFFIFLAMIDKYTQK